MAGSQRSQAGGCRRAYRRGLVPWTGFDGGILWRENDAVHHRRARRSGALRLRRDGRRGGPQERRPGNGDHRVARRRQAPHQDRRDGRSHHRHGQSDDLLHRRADRAGVQGRHRRSSESRRRGRRHGRGAGGRPPRAAGAGAGRPGRREPAGEAQGQMDRAPDLRRDQDHRQFPLDHRQRRRQPGAAHRGRPHHRERLLPVCGIRGPQHQYRDHHHGQMVHRGRVRLLRLQEALRARGRQLHEGPHRGPRRPRDRHAGHGLSVGRIETDELQHQSQLRRHARGLHPSGPERRHRSSVRSAGTSTGR